jgi:hypothetical protein
MLAIKSAERGLRRSSGSPHVRSRVPTPGRMRVRGGLASHRTRQSSSSPCIGEGGLAFSCRARVQRGESATARGRAQGIGRLLLLSFLLLLPLLLPSIGGSGQGCPRLRASDEHSFIVRVLRARRAPGHSIPLLHLLLLAPYNVPVTHWLSGVSCHPRERKGPGRNAD